MTAIVALHQTIDAVRTGLTPAIRANKAKALRMIAKGVDPNGLVDGITPMTRLVTRLGEDQKKTIEMGLSDKAKSGVDDARWNAQMDLIKSLIEAGGDPWAGNPNVWTVQKSFSYIALMTNLKKAEQNGISLRGPNGENPLHAALAQPDNQLHTYSILVKGREVIEPAWVWGRDDEGNSPLHSMWKAVSWQEDRQMEEHMRNALEITTSIARYQEREKQKEHALTVAMPILIGTLSDVNGMSETVADLMLGNPKLYQELKKYDGIENANWVSHAELAKLEGGTAMPRTAKPSRALRL